MSKNRASFSGRVEKRRRSALERRSEDVKKHTSGGDKTKATIAQSDVDALRKKLGIAEWVKN